MGYLEDIIETQKREVAGFDQEEYLEKISGQAKKYGIDYSDFSKPKSKFGVTSGPSNNKKIIIASLSLVVLTVGGIFLFKKIKSKKS